MVEKRSPAYNVGPGEFIKEELEFRHWRQEDLAAVLGMSLKATNEVIRSKQAITIETAQKLGMAFGQSPQYWLNLDTNYRLRERRQDYAIKEVGTRAEIYAHMPIGEMVKKGWVGTAKPVAVLVKEVKRFWGMETLDFSFMDNAAFPMFRKSDAYPQYNPYFARTWFHMARRCAPLVQAEAFRREALEELGEQLHRITLRPKGPADFIHALNAAGVKFLVLSHLPKTYTDGAAFMDRGNPVIVYTGRYDRVDHFWFTVAHELAHIILHLISPDDVFMDNLDRLKSAAEHAADRHATRWLRTREVLACFKNVTFKSRIRVEECAARFELHPGLVVGILQHHGILPRANLNTMKGPILSQLPGAVQEKRMLELLRKACSQSLPRGPIGSKI
jgi:HTH-type transcriptional regulator / antitoxin HigA